MPATSTRDGNSPLVRSFVVTGKAIDQDPYYRDLRQNVLVAAMPTDRPAASTSKIRRPGKPYRVDFPLVTIRDNVRSRGHAARQARTIDDLPLRCRRLDGGMQVLEWAALYPEKGVSPPIRSLRRRAIGPEHRLPTKSGVRA